MKLPLKLAFAIDWINQLIGRAAFWLGLLMILIGVYNASVRYLGTYIGENLSSNAYLEAQWYLFGAMFMLAASYALKDNVHVRVDVLYGRVGPRARAWIDLVGTLLLLIPFCVLVIWLSLDWVGFSWSIQETSPNPGGLLRYPIKTIVPIAFVMLLLQGVSQVIKAAAVLTGHLDSLYPVEEREGVDTV